MLRSVENARMRHVALDWQPARLSRSEGTQQVTVPAGTFPAETLHVDIGGGDRTWTFLVEKDEPRRILRWEANDGRRAELIASTRTKYWEKNDPQQADALRELGLTPRGRRTP